MNSAIEDVDAGSQPRTATSPWARVTTPLRRRRAGPRAFRWSLLVPLAAFTAVFTVVNPLFLGAGSVRALLISMAVLGIVAVGQTLLIICGEFDLSVGAVAGLSAVVSAQLMVLADWSPAAGIVAGLAVGALIGAINGAVVLRLGVPSFIATIGMLYIGRGLATYLSGGAPVGPLPEAVGAFGNARPLGLTWAFGLFCVLAVLGEFVLLRTVYGRNLYAIGGNEEVARLVGINTAAVKLSCFVLVGFLAALAGILQASQVALAQHTTGSGWELLVVAAVVIGGTSLFGGAGTVVGTCLGLLLLQVVTFGLLSSGVQLHWQTFAVGVIMIIAVAYDLLRRR